MANHKLILKRGLKANMPTLSVGEIVFATDEKRPYLGSSTGNQAVALLTEVTAKYTKPSTGIPESDLATAVRTKLIAGANALADAKTYTDAQIATIANVEANAKAYTDSKVAAISNQEANAKSYTDAKIDALVNGASAQYDTLKELADAITAGDSVHTSLLNNIATKADQDDFEDLVDVVNTKANQSDLTNLVLNVDTKAEQTDLDSHTNNQNNPHNVTKDQVGLGDVDNTSDLNKPISTATQGALNILTGDVSDVNLKVDNHINDTIAHLTITEHDKLTNIEENANNYTLPVSDDSTLGGVKIGQNIDVDSNGEISVKYGTTSQIGVVQLNNQLDYDSDLTAATSSTVKKLNDTVSGFDGRLSTAETLALDAKKESGYAAEVLEGLYEEFAATMDRVEDVIQGSAEGELVDARGTYNRLKDRMSALDAVDNTLLTEVNVIKNDLSNIDLSSAVNEAKQYTDDTIADLDDQVTSQIASHSTNVAQQLQTLEQELENGLDSISNDVAALNTTLTDEIANTNTTLSNEVSNLTNEINNKAQQQQEYTDNAIEEIDFIHLDGGSF